MPRFNTKNTPMVGSVSPIQTTGERVENFEGHEGYQRTAKGELFLLAASFMGGDDNFYEKSEDRYNRLIELIRDDSVYTDVEWLFEFIRWLRMTANMRTVPMVIAIEAVRVRLEKELVHPEGDDTVERDGHLRGVIGNPDLVSVSMNRADEPAEAMAYYFSKYGKNIPRAIEHGIARAVLRLYNEFSVLRYGFSRTAAVRAPDVLRLTHPKPRSIPQTTLFAWITKAESAGLEGLDQLLPLIHARKVLSAIPQEERTLTAANVSLIVRAGFTWENLSEWHVGGMNRHAWEVMIPRLGIMALLRNLRNFDQVGISEESQAIVKARLGNPERIYSAGLLPFQIYSAFRELESLTWGSTLEKLLSLCMINVPKFDDLTLVLTDMSQSMWMSTVSPRSKVRYTDAAALFGAALTVANPTGVDLVQFGSEYQQRWDNEYHAGPWVKAGTFSGEFQWQSARWNGVTERISVNKGAAILPVMARFHCMGGTKMFEAVREAYLPSKHRRVIILTDEQAFTSQWANSLPIHPSVPIYIWNFAGYQSAAMNVGRGNRHNMGGLTDASFKMISILEAGRNAKWPWNN